MKLTILIVGLIATPAWADHWLVPRDEGYTCQETCESLFGGNLTGVDEAPWDQCLCYIGDASGGE